MKRAIVATVLMLAGPLRAADLCEARIRAWRDANPGVTFQSATCGGGGTVIEINGSATLAAQANALSDAAIQAAAAAIDAEAAAVPPTPVDIPAISVLGADGKYYLIQPLLDGAPPLAVYDHASPRDGLLTNRVRIGIAHITNVQQRLWMAHIAASNRVREARQRKLIVRATITTNGLANAGDRTRWLAVQSNLVEMADWDQRAARNEWAATGATYDYLYGTNAPASREGEP